MQEKNKRNDYIGWSEFFMGVANVAAARSKDPNTQVGAVIVNPERHKIISTGYNGFPWGIDDDDAEFSWSNDKRRELGQTKYPYIAHAELNAIISAATDLIGKHLYVNLFPCNKCAIAIIQSGISEIFYQDDKYQDSEEFKISRKLLSKAGIKFHHLPGAQELVIKL